MLIEKERLWHTKYKIWWYLIGVGVLLLFVLFSCLVSLHCAWGLILGIAYIVYACKDDD